MCALIGPMTPNAIAGGGVATRMLGMVAPVAPVIQCIVASLLKRIEEVAALKTPIIVNSVSLPG